MVSKPDQTSTQENDAVNVDRLLHVLTLEYQYLGAQVLARLSARYQFLGFLTAGAAILASGFTHPFFSPETWILAILAVGVFITGLVCFRHLGRSIVTIAPQDADGSADHHSRRPNPWLLPSMLPPPEPNPTSRRKAA
jgi:hypothetical protein